MAELIKVNAPVRKPLFEGVQGENEARSIQFDITPWVEELGDGAVTATAKRSQDSQPYPVTVTKDGNTVTWKPTSTDTAFAGVGSFQLEYTVDDVLAKTCIWSTMVAPSLDPAGDPPDPYDNWLAEMREIAADALQDAQDADASAQDAEAWAKGTKNGTPVPSTADQYENNAKYFAEESYKNSEAWAVGQRGGVDVPSTDPAYENNAKYWAEQSLANQYGAFIVKSASGDIASFSDGADDVPMKSVKVAIVPKQSGSGDPSPDNVRPITGTSTANVRVDGFNQFDKDTAVTYNAFLRDLGGSYEWTYESGSRSVAIHCLPNTAYCVYANGLTPTILRVGSISDDELPTGTGWSCALEKAFVNSSTGMTLYTTGANAKWLIIQSNATSFDDVKTNLCVSFSGSDNGTYDPYAGHTTPVPLGQIVYGGSVNPISGELVIDRAMVQVTSAMISGASAYEYSGKNGVSFTAFPVNVDKYTGSIKGSSSISTVEAGAVSKNQYMWFGSANGNKVVYWIGILDALEMTLDEWKTWANEQTIQLVYPLTTPTTVQLTPTQVATLLGTNNVWADCGSVAVEYRADPTLAYAELQALILENL